MPSRRPRRLIGDEIDERPHREAGEAGLLALWAAYAILFMAVRGGTMLLRSRGEAWMRLGEHR